jgi:[glutamine synthetase] adenylyltransferase / [glutamine synthetase]-adenylyl-L-tyrosine phosphorylase
MRHPIPMTPLGGGWDSEAMGRIDRKAGFAFSSHIQPLLSGCPDPALALVNLERWLGAVSSPSSAALQAASIPETCLIFLKVLGGSSELGSCLIQNPELASLILDPSEIGRPLPFETLLANGRRLLDASTSYSHRLDRLRFLKQEAMVRIAAADQAGVWGATDCWGTLSGLADALILLSRESAWADFRIDRDLPEACPLHIAGMGKLGGRELNYSSDIDLIFFVDDDASDELLRQSVRFAEKLNRALSDPMGRGFLYRVDMRLRPYGRSGELVIRQRSLESYVSRHAETWEHMALIRSRVVAGTPEASGRWEAMRSGACFGRPHGEWRIDEILKMRRRLEERSSDRDLKRGQGGIRDVEFTVQILQLLHGAANPNLQTPGTLEALSELERRGIIPSQARRDLEEGCLFLRRVEHQVQVESGRQTHETPESPEARAKLARRMGFASLTEFDLALSHRRTLVRHWHEALLGVRDSHQSRESVLSLAGQKAPMIASWIDSLPDSESLYDSLEENESSLDRLLSLVERAPALLPWLKQNDAVSEQIMSGEILESSSPPLPPFDGHRLRTRWLRSAARTALGDPHAFPHDQGLTAEAFLRQMAPPGLAIAALGSFAEGELALESDLDLVFIAADADEERRASQFVQKAADLRTQGSPIALDLRLRPEGRQGPLAVTLGYLETYAATRLEPWERIAASRSRLICGPISLFEAFMGTVVGPGLTKDSAREALRIKGRIEKERAVHRPGCLDIKLGSGGLDDIIWTIHLLVLTEPGSAPTLQDRTLPALASVLTSKGLLTAAEAQFLTTHAQGLFSVRRTLGLLGLHDSLVPLDGDKLTALGLDPHLPDRCRQAREIMLSRLAPLQTP